MRLSLTIMLLSSICWAADKNPGPCYKVRGRLEYYNGAPSTRIWVVGTHRMLGVHSEDNNLPLNVKPLLKNFDDVIFADFVDCPVTRQREGWMQLVEVKSASHVTHKIVPYGPA